jgi:hypothetical protein
MITGSGGRTNEINGKGGEKMIKARGSKEFRAFKEGKKLSLKQAILAKCFECCGNYADGKEDCLLSDCPLYPFMPYGALWAGREKKIFSVERLESMRHRLKGGRNKAISTPILTGG